MRKAIAIIALLAMSMNTMLAQDITRVVTAMPNNIITKLDASQRDLLIANPEDTTQTVVQLEGRRELKRLAISSDFISIRTSDAGVIQIKLLPLINNSRIICVVKTVCGGAVCDSQMQFYTTDWMPIESASLFPAKTKEWFIKDGVDKSSQGFINAFAAVDMDPVKITLFPDNLSASAELTIKGYLSEEEYKKVQPYLKEEPKVFEWDKTSFK